MINYLKDLIENKKIVKRVDNQRRTYYKPIDLKSLVKARLNEDFEELDKFLALNQLDLEIVTDKGPFSPPSHHTASFFLKNKVDEWENKISQDFKEYLSQKHPELDSETLDFEAKLFRLQLFKFLEGNTQLNLVTSLNIPPVDVSKWKRFSAKEERGLYAKIWDKFFEILLLLLMENYERYGNFGNFLKDSQNSKLLLLLEVNTDFSLLAEYQEEVTMKIGDGDGFSPIFRDWARERQKQRKMSGKA